MKKIGIFLKKVKATCKKCKLVFPNCLVVGKWDAGRNQFQIWTSFIRVWDILYQGDSTLFSWLHEYIIYIYIYIYVCMYVYIYAYNYIYFYIYKFVENGKLYIIYIYIYIYNIYAYTCIYNVYLTYHLYTYICLYIFIFV